jgi:hypothetical protein
MNEHTKVIEMLKNAPNKEELYTIVKNAVEQRDWRNVVRWTCRLYELVKYEKNDLREKILHWFLYAHMQQHAFSGAHDCLPVISKLFNARVDLLKSMGDVREQGFVLCKIGECLINSVKFEDASMVFNQARRIAEDHGIISVECAACIGLGQISFVAARKKSQDDNVREAKTKIALDFFRNAVIAATLADINEPFLTLRALYELAVALGNCDGTVCMPEMIEVALRYASLVNSLPPNLDAELPTIHVVDYAPITLPETLTVEEARDRLDPTLPDKHIENARLMHVWALLYEKKKQPQKVLQFIDLLINNIDTGDSEYSTTGPCTHYYMLHCVKMQINTWSASAHRTIIIKQLQKKMADFWDTMKLAQSAP